MAAGKYDALRKSAIKLVKSFGRRVPCQLVRSLPTDGTDPDKPWNVGDPVVRTFLFTGVVISGEPSEAAPDADVKTIIVPGDIVAQPSVEDAALLCGDVQNLDRIITDSVEYGINSIKNIKPDDLTIIFKLSCSTFPPIMATPVSRGLTTRINMPLNSYADANDAILVVANVAWNSDTPALNSGTAPALVFEEKEIDMVPHPKDSGAPWARIAIRNYGGRSAALGNKRFRRTGIVWVQVFVPNKDGKAKPKALALAAVVQKAYESTKGTGVSYKDVSVTEKGDDASFYRVDCAASFYWDQIR